ncbi:sulfatase [Sporothrix schenckii 1099-18]|uniref:Sulfatase n=1 Tax=Sporothrix schenckii 1099-18 TaxID=1397361 RepID=A0A0F2M1Q2_SPOSC|nr:sulfatase [Sporothrix schenckii 1099-18]KJR83638.1 sulfatase [Sporothrix schenckii 1099-18]
MTLIPTTDSFSKTARPIPVPVDSKNVGKRPNFIMFMLDQLRHDALGCTQDSTGTGTKPSPIPTRNIGSFRRRGTLFTECYVQASVCAQSLCSKFTGTYPHISCHRSLNNLTKPWEPNVLRSLKENGYHVACLAPQGDTFASTVTEMSLNKYGFLETPDCLPGFAEPGNNSQPDADDIWGRLSTRDCDRPSRHPTMMMRDKPRVLFRPLLFPHCPFQVEEPYFSKYDRESVGSVVSTPEAKTGYEPRYMQTIRERYGTARATDAMWREIKATYYGMIARLDDQFGRLVKALDDLCIWKDTVTLFFTDHGEYLGDHGLIEK